MTQTQTPALEVKRAEFEAWQAEYEALDVALDGGLTPAKAQGNCDGCGEPDRVLSKTGLCPQCLHERYGYERGEEAVGYGMVLGAIRQALGLGVERATILSAVHEALDPSSTYHVPHDWRYTR